MATNLAAQMYTLRDFTKTPSDIASTLAKVKKIGYNAVQLSALGPIDPNELAKILHNEGLVCCATHVGLDQMKNQKEKTLEEHKLWGCQYTAIGGFFVKEAPTTQTWTNFITEYNQLAKSYAGTGLSLGYHNHSHELAHYDGKPALQILIDGLDRSVWFEIDTYWITHGGGDPAAWIRKVKGRIPCVHLKDMVVNHQRQQAMAEVGEGNLNWPEILKACRESGVKWYIVEQDICQRDPFESLAISLRHCHEMGLE
jgi:sugar phosphate isomerase/epimerase